MKKAVMILVAMLAVFVVRAGDDQSFTNKQVWSESQSYVGIPDKLVLKDGHVVLCYPDTKVWKYTVVATSNGVPIKLVIGGKLVDETEITATMIEVESAITTNAPTVQRQVLKALLKVAKDKLSQ